MADRPDPSHKKLTRPIPGQKFLTKVVRADEAQGSLWPNRYFFQYPQTQPLTCQKGFENFCFDNLI